MSNTSTEVKNKWNAKHYKRWGADVKFELFDQLEEARNQEGMSRSEFLTWALEQFNKVKAGE